MGKYKKQNKLKEILKKTHKPFTFLLIAIFILITPIIGSKITWGHDYFFHSTNMILTNEHINIFQLDILLPKVFGGTIANGFGYGTGIFYPPLSYYLTSYITYILNLSSSNNVLSLTCLEILIIISSGLIMYKFVHRISNDKYISMISSVSYISSTYFLCNIYTRTAIAEALVSVFLPIVFYGLYELFYGKKEKFIPLFTLGYVGLVNSHLLLSVFITIIILIVFLLNLKKVLKKDKIIRLVISSILILLLSSPFLVPLIEHTIYGDYSVYNESHMYSIEELKENALVITDFFFVKNKIASGVEVYINFITIVTSFFAIIFHKKIFQKENKGIYKTALILVILSAFISTRYFPWEKMPSIIQTIQFPWRLMGITTFGLSILSGFFIKSVDESKRKMIAYSIVVIMTFYGYSTIARESISEIQIPTVMHMGVQNEYLPSNTQSNLLYYVKRNKEIKLKDGEAHISIKENNTPYLKSEINLKSDNIKIELPRLYYLGYDIKLTDENGNIDKIEYYENDKGFIELDISKSGVLEVDYKGTKANKIANYTCLITLLSILIFIIYKKRKIGK